MSKQFNRSYELIITPKEGDVRIVRGLRIDFEVKKSILSYPNLAKVMIFNPNAETLSALKSKYTKVVLNVGYGNDLTLIFTGEIRNIMQTKSSVDRVVTFFAGDGERDWQNSIFNKTYTEDVSIKNIITDIISTFKETTSGIIQGLPEISDNLIGQTLSGSSKDLLDKYAKAYNFQWSIEDGEVNIISDNEVLPNLESVIITSATGMIGTPTVTEIGADVTTLLNPKLTPNSSFTIESINADIQLGNLYFRDIRRSSAEGTYKVQEVVFKGDSREGDWLALVKGRSLNVGN